MKTLLCVSLLTVIAHAGETPAPPPVVAPLPVPESAKPLQVDLFIGPLRKEDAAKHKAVLEKDSRIGGATCRASRSCSASRWSRATPSSPFRDVFRCA